MGLSGKLYTQAALPSGKNPGTHRVEVWVGPRADLGSFVCICSEFLQCSDVGLVFLFLSFCVYGSMFCILLIL